MAIDIHSKLVAVVSAVLGTAVVAVAASTLIPNKVIRGEFFNFGVKISKEANEKKTNEANDSKKADEEKKPAALAAPAAAKKKVRRAVLYPNNSSTLADGYEMKDGKFYIKGTTEEVEVED